MFSGLSEKGGPPSILLTFSGSSGNSGHSLSHGSQHAHVSPVVAATSQKAQFRTAGRTGFVPSLTRFVLCPRSDHHLSLTRCFLHLLVLFPHLFGVHTAARERATRVSFCYVGYGYAIGWYFWIVVSLSLRRPLSSFPVVCHECLSVSSCDEEKNERGDEGKEQRSQFTGEPEKVFCVWQFRVPRVSECLRITGKWILPDRATSSRSSTGNAVGFHNVASQHLGETVLLCLPQNVPSMWMSKAEYDGSTVLLRPATLVNRKCS